MIKGVVYHDMCAPPGPGDPTPNPESGCEPTSGGGYRANGSLDVGEPGLAGVAVHLATGSCPGSSSASTTTNSAGEFTFGGLPPGNHCVSVSASENSGILIPGRTTRDGQRDRRQDGLRPHFAGQDRPTWAGLPFGAVGLLCPGIGDLCLTGGLS
jgi:hypothetical protein